MDKDKFSILTTLCFSAIGLAVSYSCYGWSVYRLWNGAITYGTMTLFLQICSTLTSSFSAMVGLLPGAVSVATSAGRIMEITNLDCENDSDGRVAKELEKEARVSGITLKIEGVSFTYKDATAATLCEVGMTASPGDVVALVGPSGEGKTTLLRLILGLMEPDCGTITFEAEGVGKLCASDHAMSAVDEMSILASKLEEMIQESGIEAENFKELKQYMTKYVGNSVKSL